MGMQEIKKYRKGKSEKLDFLDDIATDNKKKPQSNKNREFKNKKFGFGGQKKRSKWNTENSSKEMSGFNPKIHSSKKNNKASGNANRQGPGNKQGKGRGGGKANKFAKNNRPGKASRQKKI